MLSGIAWVPCGVYLVADKIISTADLVNDKIGRYDEGAMVETRPSLESPDRPYHHGDLRRALLDAAVAKIGDDGLATLSLREVARRVGVSHAAPRHHFGDKAGLLTAIATDGFRRLTDELRAAWEADESFLEVGVAYVRFAVRNPVHFEVMYRPEVYRPNDPTLIEARRASGEFLYGPVGCVAGRKPGFKRREAGIAAWSIVHGLATLWLNGNLPLDAGRDPVELARAVLRYTF
jgi:AcrR family transcriptional regulator